VRLPSSTADEPRAIEAVSDSRPVLAALLLAFEGLDEHTRVVWPYPPQVLHRGLPVESHSVVAYNISKWEKKKKMGVLT
jgi:hypothetical protein